MQWISINDRLPEEYTEILMTFNDLVMEGFFCSKTFHHPHSDGGVGEEQDGVTHWMPLPLPPEET